jgi:hypothetical protein
VHEYHTTPMTPLHPVNVHPFPPAVPTSAGGVAWKTPPMPRQVTPRHGMPCPALPCQQVYEQPGVECIPLVMEPRSRLYTDPLIVLDFQSLYPSMIIAYNLCFSTSLGRPPHAAAGAGGGAGPRLGACAEFALPAGERTRPCLAAARGAAGLCLCRLCL